MWRPHRGTRLLVDVGRLVEAVPVARPARERGVGVEAGTVAVGRALVSGVRVVVEHDAVVSGVDDPAVRARYRRLEGVLSELLVGVDRVEHAGVDRLPLKDSTRSNLVLTGFVGVEIVLRVRTGTATFADVDRVLLPAVGHDGDDRRVDVVERRPVDGQHGQRFFERAARAFLDFYSIGFFGRSLVFVHAGSTSTVESVPALVGHFLRDRTPVLVRYNNPHALNTCSIKQVVGWDKLYGWSDTTSK